uniref:Uncharacterized protein n=1 Tax=Oryza meridionalis TaxID=40149 RepID=A0A0E0EFP3_9ORYZ
MSRSPWSLTVRSTAAATCASSVTSQYMYEASGPSSAADVLDIGDDDLGTILDELLCCNLSDATGSTGNDSHLASQTASKYIVL